MQWEQTARTQPMVDCVFPEAESDQLCARDDPMLPLGQQPDLPVDRSSLSFPAHTAAKCRLDRRRRGHGIEPAGSGRAGGAQKQEIV
jgi:hypothetical protein